MGFILGIAPLYILSIASIHCIPLPLDDGREFGRYIKDDFSSPQDPSELLEKLISSYNLENSNENPAQNTDEEQDQKAVDDWPTTGYPTTRGLWPTTGYPTIRE